jgi:hypothetical protein
VTVSSSPHIDVAVSRFGGVIAELAWMLADALDRAGAVTAVVPADDLALTSDVVVLVGSGPEFDGAASRLRGAGARRPQVLLWAPDPFPPTGLSDAAISSGRRYGQRVNQLRGVQQRLPGWIGRPDADGVVKRSLRRLALVGAGGRSALDPSAHDVNGTDLAFAFSRLTWVDAAVADGVVDEVMVTSPASVRTLAEHGVRATYAPVAFHPSMGADLDGDRDIDVLFLGRTVDGRADRLARLAAGLARHGVELTVVDRACYGDDRAALLNRARVSVNLHKFPWHLERIRLLLSMANGALVVSETPVPNPEPFVVGRHLVAAPFEDLPRVIVEHLADETTRRAIVAEAHRLNAGGHGMDGVAEQVLRLSASPVATRGR